MDQDLQTKWNKIYDHSGIISMVHSGTRSTTIDLNPLYLEILFPNIIHSLTINSQTVNYITRFPIRTNIEGIPY